MKRVISIDVESNGLWGVPFQVAMIVTDENGDIVDSINYRCPILGKVNKWVKENVLPKIEDIKETHNSLKDMLKDVSEFWLKYKNDAMMLVHMGFIVESGLFRNMYACGYIGEFDGPYEYIELAELLRCNGEKYDSVDEYIEKYGLNKPDIIGGTHNAMYDALATLEVYKHLVKNKNIDIL